MFPKVFIAPDTTAECAPPISTQIAQAGAMPAPAQPAAQASRTTAASRSSTSAAPATASAASGRPTSPGRHEPRRSPRRGRRWSLIQPPASTPTAIPNSGSAAGQPTSAGV